MVTQRFESYLSQKKHIIWDFNGTLINDVDYVVDIVNSLLTSADLAPISKELFLNQFGFPISNFYQAIGLGTDQFEINKLSEVFVSQYQKSLHMCQIYPHSRELLEHFAAKGLGQSILSAADIETLNMAVDRLHLRSYFENIFDLADKLARSKLELGAKLIEQRGAPVADYLLIGDTDHDLEVGQSLGVDVILIAHGHQSFERLSALHDSVLRFY